MTDHRWAWAEIDLSAIDYNIRTFKQLLKPDTLFMAVLKGNGYGHGAERVAFTALMAGANRFGVATVDEALALRAAGITAPIQILSEPPVTAITDLLDADITCTVTTPEFLNSLSGEAMLRQKTARYHLKINTGMNRIGIRPSDAASFLIEAATLPALQLEGVFTHFATADQINDWDAQNQLELFEHAIELIRGAGIDPGIVHAANTAATILMPESHFDMVRVGIGIYGLHPSHDTYGKINLDPAMTIKAKAFLVKPIALGEGVGYGLTYQAFERVDIATLSLGYADGVPRCASNAMSLLVRGKRVDQVGRVCMDQLMVAVPEDLGIRAGEEFVLVGEQGSERIFLDELAEKAGTINYELACDFGLRLERVYI